MSQGYKVATAEQHLSHAVRCQHALADSARALGRDDIAHLVAADQLAHLGNTNLSRTGAFSMAVRLERMAGAAAEPSRTRYGYAAAMVRSFAEFYL